MFWDLVFSVLVRVFAWRHWRKPRLTVLIYHRVLDNHDPLRADMVTRQQFDQQIGWVNRHFRVMSLPDAVAALQSNTLPARALAITFDDGYKDNATNALPVLQKHGVSASFFITCDYLSTLPKWDFLTEAIRATIRQKVTLLEHTYPLTTEAEKATFAVEAPELIKQYPQAEADACLAQLIDDLGRPALPDLMMNPGDIATLQKAGMDIGAHSISHVILSRVPAAIAETEIAGSKQQLAQATGADIQGFAYPNGLYPVDLTDDHIRMVEAAGYRYAVTTNIGCSHDISERFNLKRFTPWRRNKPGFLAELCVNLWRC